MSKYISYLLFCTVLLSCSTDKQLEQKTDMDTNNGSYQDGNIVLTTLNSEIKKGIEIQHFVADTAVNKKEEGIRTSFSLQVSQQILNEIQQQGFDALLVDVQCTSDKGKKFSYIDTYLPEISGKVVYPDKHTVFSHASTRSISLDIPFRKLELSKGKHTLTISLIIYPITFKVDTNRIETKHISRIGSNAFFKQDYTATILTPTLTAHTFTLKGYTIKTEHKKASTYDFTLMGTGLPDPYWQMWCGEELLYFSAYTKNSLVVKETQTSSTFYTAPKDVITLTFLDFDNGPFNRDDLIEQLEGTCQDFKNSDFFANAKVRVHGLTVNKK